MNLFRHPVRSALALALACAAVPAFAQHNYSKTVFFGDSLTDSGTFRPGLVQVGGPEAAILGRFTTNPGLVWAEFLADYYGTDAWAANQGGDNFAVGGARVNEDRASPFGTVPSLASQLNHYLAANGGRADPNALYAVWGGANDLFAVASGEKPPASIGSVVAAQVGIVAKLQQGGARYVLVPNIPDLGQTPQFLAQGAAASVAGTQLSTAYNNALYAGLGSAGLRVIPMDTFNLLREIAASPSAYGFVNATGTACNIESSLTCSPFNLVTPGADESYVFADGVHPTTGAHRVVSQYAVSLLEGPRQIALLPHTASVTGRARAEQVAGHVGARPEADGTYWWGGLRADTQRYEHGDLYDGAAPAGLFGVDWVRGATVYGAFAGFGRGRYDLGQEAGDFRQTDTTLGGFIGWHGDNAWANAQLSYSWLGHDVSRDIRLGAATRTHTGSPDGSNFSAGLSTGYRFGEGAFRHGPVLSVLSQRIEVDGYAESGGNSSALILPDQKVDSLIGSLGWQASYAANPSFSPYLRLSYDREFERPAEEVFAQLQSIQGLAPYAVPGLEFDRDYGTLGLGARTRIFGHAADVGVTSTLGQKGGHNATLFITLGGGF